MLDVPMDMVDMALDIADMAMLPLTLMAMLATHMPGENKLLTRYPHKICLLLKEQSL